MKTTVENYTDVQDIENEYKDFILNGKHPCVMAKATFRMNKYHLKVYDEMNDPNILKNLLSDLKHYIEEYNFEDNNFESFLAVFPNNYFIDEISFEKALWNTLQSLHEIDQCEWDHRVSDDPDDPNFSFSLNGRAFYIIGMHPESSRMARQTPYTTLVFNLHSQFEKLREIGTYQKVKSTIRKNDETLQGNINPVLDDFGDDSETKQYSGRKVETHWKCPFHKK